MKSKVLIVSNLTSAVNVLKSLLEENSCEVGAVVTDYQSAFDHANGTLYDIVVINYPVDECDCISLAKKITPPSPFFKAFVEFSTPSINI